MWGLNRCVGGSKAWNPVVGLINSAFLSHVLVFRFQRPAWSTGTLIPASFLCGIASAVFIWRGGQKTKRTKEVEERLRLALKIEKNPEEFRIVDRGTRTIVEEPDRERQARESSDPVSSRSTSDEQGDGKRRSDEDRASTHGDGESAMVDEKMEIPADAAHAHWR